MTIENGRDRPTSKFPAATISSPHSSFTEKITAGVNQLDQWIEKLGMLVNNTTESFSGNITYISENPDTVLRATMNSGRWIINNKFEASRYLLYTGGIADIGLVGWSLVNGSIFGAVLFTTSGLGIFTAIDNMETHPYEYGYCPPSEFDIKSSLVSGLAGVASAGLYCSGNPDLFYWGLGLAAFSVTWGCIVIGSRKVPPVF